MVGDPCYASFTEDHSHPIHNWGKFCASLDEEPKYPTDQKYPTIKQLDYALGHKGLGVVVSTGYGDGVYPVYVKRNAEGRITGLRVDFD
jgi:hypothetical protein